MNPPSLPLKFRFHFVIIATTLSLVPLLGPTLAHAQPANIRYAKQGYSMRLCFDNRGVLGQMAYPGGNAPPESLGLEYPIGSPHEHISGAGIWVGGILDTSTGPTPSFISGVSTAYEGWTGPLYELYPGSFPADSIWKVVGRGVPRPATWNTYWGNSIPSSSFSDNDHYCKYDDDHVNVAGHVRLRLKVVQSGYVWNDPYAEAIHILEYKIMNLGAKRVDSAYVGIFLDADVGPFGVPNYYLRNLTGYYPDIRTAYVHNPVDPGSTPIGLTAIHALRPLDSLRIAYRWWPSPQHPPTDASKYAILSSGRIDSNQSLTNLSNTRCLISVGPFTLHPGTDPVPDTLVLAFGIVSGQNLNVMRQQADRARVIYANGGVVGVEGGDGEIPARFELFQNYPNPFNPVTTIRFALPKAGIVKLTVFDVLGRQIAELVNQGMTAGVHSVVWDAPGQSSGLYFYTLQSGSFVGTRKLILLR